MTSTLIGARRMEPLEDHLAPLEVRIPGEAEAHLDEATAPALPFPIGLSRNMTAFFADGTTINGRPSEPFSLSPEGDADRH